MNVGNKLTHIFGNISLVLKDKSSFNSIPCMIGMQMLILEIEVLDMGNSRAIDIKYCKTIELCWNFKTMVETFIQDKVDAWEEVLQLYKPKKIKRRLLTRVISFLKN